MDKQGSPTKSSSLLDAFCKHVLKVDVLVTLALLSYALRSSPPDHQVILNSHLPRVVIELINLISIGFIERWVILPMLQCFDETTTMASKLRFREKLPFDKMIRDKEYNEAQQKPWLHNKFAVLWLLCVFVPFDVFFRKEVDAISSAGTMVTLSAKQLLKQLLFGLIVIDFILGTAHLASHRGPFKKYLSKFHAPHHTRHQNFAAVKYIGNPFDLEVFLTQVCFAFIPRLLGFDVLTGAILVDVFSLQLLLEHTGYSIFSVSQHHEAHHRYGSVGFYHFPLVEMVFGRMPSLKQLEHLST
jgi:hypothetical protein